MPSCHWCVFYDVSVSSYFRNLFCCCWRCIVMLMPEMCDGALRIRKQSSCPCMQRVRYVRCLAALSSSLSVWLGDICITTASRTQRMKCMFRLFSTGEYSLVLRNRRLAESQWHNKQQIETVDILMKCQTTTQVYEFRLYIVERDSGDANDFCIYPNWWR